MRPSFFFSAPAKKPLDRVWPPSRWPRRSGRWSRPACGGAWRSPAPAWCRCGSSAQARRPRPWARPSAAGPDASEPARPAPRRRPWGRLRRARPRSWCRVEGVGHRLGLDADRLRAGGGDEEQHAAAVRLGRLRQIVFIAASALRGLSMTCSRIRPRVSSAPTTLVGGAAAQRAGQRQHVAVGALGGGREDDRLGIGELGHRVFPSMRGPGPSRPFYDPEPRIRRSAAEPEGRSRQ